MEITRANIESIRNQAKKKGIKPSSEEIRKAIAECYPDAGEDTAFEAQMIPGIVEILISQHPAPLVISEMEKQDLIAGGAREVGLDLSASEVKEIAVSIASGFQTREELINSVMEAIVAYAEYRIDVQNTAVANTGERIKRKIAEGNATATQTFASINKTLEATNADFKSQLTEITALFTVPG